MDPKKTIAIHIIIKMPKIKDKERILKAARERQRVTYKEFPCDFQLISQKKLCRQVLKVMKSKDLQPTLLYPAKLPFRMKGQRKCFPDKVKLKEFIITKPLFRKC